MAQNIPTQEEALEIYLINQIFTTKGEIIRINNTINRLEKDMLEAQSSEARMEWAYLIDNERLGLEIYEFRLDFLQNQLEEFKSTIRDNMWYIEKHNLV